MKRKDPSPLSLEDYLERRLRRLHYNALFRVRDAVEEYRAARQTGAILGVPCDLKGRRVRRLIKRVFKRVCDEHGDDWQRILSRLMGVRELSKKAQGAAGKKTERYLELSPLVRDWIYEHPTLRPGFIDLHDNPEWRAYTDRSVVAAIAHELGHFATGQGEIEDRTKHGDQNLAAELSAAYYAYTWGYGTDTAYARRYEGIGYEELAPGKSVVAGGRRRYVITRRFYLRPVKTNKRRRG